MVRITKSFKFVAVAMLASAFLIMPLKAHALIPPLLGFDGWSVYSMPCTCSGALWGFFAPLYLASVPITSPLVYEPYGTYPMPYYLLTMPSVPHQGAYVPGVQACWQYAGVTCFPMPSIGVMAFAGTGLPGGK